MKLNQEAVCKVGNTLVKGIVNIVNDDYSDPYYHFYIQDDNGISKHPLILASDKVKILIK